MFLGQRLDFPAIVGIGLIIAGVAVINIFPVDRALTLLNGSRQAGWSGPTMPPLPSRTDIFDRKTKKHMNGAS